MHGTTEELKDDFFKTPKFTFGILWRSNTDIQDGVEYKIVDLPIGKLTIVGGPENTGVLRFYIGDDVAENPDPIDNVRSWRGYQVAFNGRKVVLVVQHTAN